MRLFSAVGLLVLSSLGAMAQKAAAPVHITVPAVPAHSVVPTAGALGGSFASVGISRPLGGIVPVSNRRKNAPPVARYVGPVYYVPNAYGYDSSSYQQAYQEPGPYAGSNSDGPAPPSQRPVIINQYFGSRESGTPVTTSEESFNPGDPIGTLQNYYLIAYKDRSVYSALAYWIEGDTIHYVTTQNTHNQASLSLIDLDRTTKLNADNSVPFSLTGK